MLYIDVPGRTLWDEKTEEFFSVKPIKLCLEHSLVSLSKWESKWQKPFFSDDHTNEEILDYVKCMTITGNVKDEVYLALTEQNIKDINDYIQSSRTATVITERGAQRKSRQIVTSELIYYWMISLNIPFECEKWHLNRLLTLVRVCSEENKALEGGNKMSKKDILKSNAAINAARRKKYNTHG